MGTDKFSRTSPWDPERKRRENEARRMRAIMQRSALLNHVSLAHRPRDTVPVFTPASLYSSGEQGGWYDPSDLASVFVDAAGTTPAAVDGPVGRISDKSGRGNHLIQNTTAQKPILRSSAGLYWLEFDGVDDAIATAGNVSMPTTQDFAYCVQSTDAQWLPFHALPVGNKFIGVVMQGNGSSVINDTSTIGSPSTSVDGVAVSPDTRAAMYTAMSSTDAKVAQITGTAWPSGFPLAFGGYTAFELAGRFYGAVISPADTTKRAALLTYLAAKAGRTL